MHWIRRETVISSLMGLLMILAVGCQEASKADSSEPKGCSRILGYDLCPKVCSYPPAKPGVINLHLPKLSVGANGPPDPNERPTRDRKPLNLTVAVQYDGFQVGAAGAIVPPSASCPKDGPTICLEDSTVQIKESAKHLRQVEEGESAAAKRDAVIGDIVDAYNWRGLYSKLIEIKKEHPDTETIKVATAPRLPHALTVRVFDVVRYRLQQDAYETREAFRAAETKSVKTDQGRKRPEMLFPDPIIGISK